MRFTETPYRLYQFLIHCGVIVSVRRAGDR